MDGEVPWVLVPNPPVPPNGSENRKSLALDFWLRVHPQNLNRMSVRRQSFSWLVVRTSRADRYFDRHFSKESRRKTASLNRATDGNP